MAWPFCLTLQKGKDASRQCSTCRLIVRRDRRAAVPKKARRAPPPASSLTAFVNAIGWALRALQAEKAPYEQREQTLREAMTGLEGLTAEQFGQWHWIVTFLYPLTQ